MISGGSENARYEDPCCTHSDWVLGRWSVYRVRQEFEDGFIPHEIQTHFPGGLLQISSLISLTEIITFLRGGVLSVCAMLCLG